jgi:hypothetical protein
MTDTLGRADATDTVAEAGGPEQPATTRLLSPSGLIPALIVGVALALTFTAALATGSTGRARRADPATPEQPAVRYDGGAVLTHPSVLAVYWLPPKLQDGTPRSFSDAQVTRNNEILNTLPGTFYFDGLRTLTSRGHHAPAFVGMRPFQGRRNSVLWDTPYPKGRCGPGHRDCVSEQDVLHIVGRAVVDDRWRVTSQTVVVVYLDPAERFTSSWDGSRGFHFPAVWTQGMAETPFAVAVIGNESPAAGPKYGLDGLNRSASITTTHELVEAFTDPQLTGWHAVPATAPSGETEIADVCEGKDGGLAAAPAETWLFPVAAYTVDGRHCAGMPS